MEDSHCPFLVINKVGRFLYFPLRGFKVRLYILKDVILLGSKEKLRKGLIFALIAKGVQE